MALPFPSTGRPMHDASWEPLLAVGGLDSSGGAGLLRDYLTAGALGARAHLLATAYTLQTSAGVEATEARLPAAVQADVAAALVSVRPAAIKIGMVGNAAIATSLVAGLHGFAGPIVYDPVLQASSGGRLFQGDVAELRELLRRVSLVTPNLGEASLLSGGAVRDRAGAVAAGEALLRAGARAVLIKGGHLTGDAEDVLVTSAGTRSFSAPRLPGPSPRGTGCALATAIAVGLARGEDLEASIAAAKSWLHGAIAGAQLRGDQRVL